MSFWDTIEVGSAALLGSHRFEAEEVQRFAEAYDPQPFHLDEKAAKASVLGGLCASGWHTAATCMRLNVDDGARRVRAWIAAGNPAPRFGPSPGIKNLKWPRPVYVGDTVTYTQTVAAKRASASRAGWGVVEYETTGVNQEGITVFGFEAAVFVSLD